MENEIERTPREQIGMSMARVSRRRFQLSDITLERMGIGPGQVPILSELKFHGEMTQRELAEHTHVTAATISGTLKRMERSGIVIRTDDTRDARVSIVRLSPSGQELVKQAWQNFYRADLNMLEGFSDDECTQLLEYLERMRVNLDSALKNETEQNA